MNRIVVKHKLAESTVVNVFRLRMKAQTTQISISIFHGMGLGWVLRALTIPLSWPFAIVYSGSKLGDGVIPSVHWCSVQICNLWVSSRLGLDEGAVDITAEVKARVASGAIQHGFSGLLVDSCYIASTKVSPSGASGSREYSEKEDVHGEDTEITMHIQEGFAMTDGNKLLMVGSQLVTEIRTALEKETGFQVSCGVAHNVRP